MNPPSVELAPVPKQLLVLGSTDPPGSEFAPGPYGLSLYSTERLSTADTYLEQHPGVGVGEDWTVALVGGYAGMAYGEGEITTDLHHGPLMKRAFTARASSTFMGVSEDRIRSGAGSDSTVTDFAYAMGLTFDEEGRLRPADRPGFEEGGSLSPNDYTAENPLGIVAHPGHMKRILRVAKAFGFLNVLPITTDGEYGLPEQRDSALREFVLRAVLTWGTNNPETMRKRELLVAGAMNQLRRALGNVTIGRSSQPAG